MKNKISLILLSIMAIFFLVGCGGNGQSGKKILSSKGTLSDPYVIGDTIEFTAWDQVAGTALSSTGRELINPMSVRITNIEIEPQTYIKDQTGSEINAYLITYDLEITDTELNERVAFEDYIKPRAYDKNGGFVSAMFDSYAIIPDGYTYESMALGFLPIKGNVMKLANVVYYEDINNDIEYFSFYSLNEEDGEWHDRYVKVK